MSGKLFPPYSSQGQASLQLSLLRKRYGTAPRWGTEGVRKVINMCVGPSDCVSVHKPHTRVSMGLVVVGGLREGKREGNQTQVNSLHIFVRSGMSKTWPMAWSSLQSSTIWPPVLPMGLEWTCWQHMGCTRWSCTMHAALSLGAPGLHCM